MEKVVAVTYQYLKTEDFQKIISNIYVADPDSCTKFKPSFRTSFRSNVVIRLSSSACSIWFTLKLIRYGEIPRRFLTILRSYYTGLQFSVLPFGYNDCFLLTTTDSMDHICKFFLIFAFTFYAPSMIIYQSWYQFYCHYCNGFAMEAQLFLINFFSFKRLNSLSPIEQKRPELSTIYRRLGIKRIWFLLISQLQKHSTQHHNFLNIHIFDENGKFISSPITLLHILSYNDHEYYITHEVYDTLKQLCQLPKIIDQDYSIELDEKKDLFKINGATAQWIISLACNEVIISSELASRLLLGIFPVTMKKKFCCRTGLR